MPSGRYRTWLRGARRLIIVAFEALAVIGYLTTMYANGGWTSLLKQVAVVGLLMILITLLGPPVMDWADRRFRNSAKRRDGPVLNLTEE